jgi:hypothetical protein
MRALLIAVVLLLCASATFAVMAVNSPRTWPACITHPKGSGGGSGDKAEAYVVPLDASLPDCSTVVSQYNSRVWTYQSYAEIAEGLAVLALLLPMLTVKRLDFSWLHRPLAPWFPPSLVLPLALVGVSVFALYPIESALWYQFQYNPSLLYIDLRADLLSTGLSIGVGAVVMWCLTMFVVSLCKGIVSAFKWFGLPAIIYLGCMVFAFDRGEMTLHVTGFATWFYSGFWVVSNWFVLMVTSFLFVCALAYRRLGLR